MNSMLRRQARSVLILSNLFLVAVGCDGNDGDGGASDENPSQSANYDCPEMSSFNASAAGEWTAYYVEDGVELGPVRLSLNEMADETSDYVALLGGTLELSVDLTVNVSGRRTGPIVELQFLHPTSGEIILRGIINDSGSRLCGSLNIPEQLHSVWRAERSGGSIEEGDGGDPDPNMDFTKDLTGSWQFTSVSEDGAPDLGPLDLELVQSSSNVPARLTGNLSLPGAAVDLRGTISGIDDDINLFFMFTAPDGCEVTASGSVTEDWSLIKGRYFLTMDAQFNCSDFGTWEARRQ